MKYLKCFEDIIHDYDSIVWDTLPQEYKDVFKFKIGDIVKIKDGNMKLYKITSLSTKPEINMLSNGSYYISNIIKGDSMLVSGSSIQLATEDEIVALKYNL